MTNQVNEVQKRLRTEAQRKELCKRLKREFGKRLHNLWEKSGLKQTAFKHFLKSQRQNDAFAPSDTTFAKMLAGNYLNPTVLLGLVRYQEEGVGDVLSDSQKELLGLNAIFEKVYGVAYAEYNRLTTEQRGQAATWEYPEIDLPAGSWDPVWDPPARLLRAECSPVPFHGRKDAMQAVLTWIHDESSLLLRLYSGPGGVGKTRLALEVCREIMKSPDWAAVWVSKQFPNERWDELLAGNKNLLIVIDYAETCHDVVARLIEHGRNAPERPVKVRFLLLARDPWGWWPKFCALVKHEFTSEVELGGLECSTKRSFRIAVEAFAHRLGKEMPGGNPTKMNAPEMKRVLFLHIKAQTFLAGEKVDGKDALLQWVLNREISCWERHLKHNVLPMGLVDGISQAMAAITEVQGVKTFEDGMAVLKELSIFDGQSALTLKKIVDLLHLCYPAEDYWIAPLAPDMLGQFLMRKFFSIANVRREISRITLGCKD